MNHTEKEFLVAFDENHNDMIDEGDASRTFRTVKSVQSQKRLFRLCGKQFARQVKLGQGVDVDK